MTMLIKGSPSPPEIHESGERITEARPGSLYCVGCGFAFSLAALDALPRCPNCGGSRFRRSSIFGQQPTMDTEAIEAREEAPNWVDQARAKIDQPGHYLAFHDGHGIQTARLQTGWTRIGRSSSADVRFDDATVSRRHALVVLTDEGELRCLDDRSMNGLFVNGERVEWAPLADGDELEIGRYRLYVLEN